MRISVKKVKDQLKKVFDPELNISIIDLGLIYDVSIHRNDNVTILMTLTTVGCPLIEHIKEDIIIKIHELGIKKQNIKVEVTFDPPWTIEKMSKKAKKLLGI